MVVRHSEECAASLFHLAHSSCPHQQGKEFKAAVFHGLLEPISLFFFTARKPENNHRALPLKSHKRKTNIQPVTASLAANEISMERPTVDVFA